jgi:hypothetical protein
MDMETGYAGYTDVTGTAFSLLIANDVDEMIIVKSMEKVMGPLVWEPRRAVPEDRKC